MTARLGFLGLLLGTLAACGGDRDDPGSGTGTLRVIADGRVSEASTVVVVEITARGVPVLDAEVRIGPGDGGESTVAGALAAPGLYQARFETELRYVRLAVEAGADRLDGAIDGPARFRITRPEDDVRVRYGERLLMIWTRPEDEPMDEVELSVVDRESSTPLARVALDEDPGEGRVPLPRTASRLMFGVVDRTDEVRLAGGAEGSMLRLTRSSQVRFELVE